jgi:hypothetical protein
MKMVAALKRSNLRIRAVSKYRNDLKNQDLQ